MAAGWRRLASGGCRILLLVTLTPAFPPCGSVRVVGAVLAIAAGATLPVAAMSVRPAVGGSCVGARAGRAGPAGRCPVRRPWDVHVRAFTQAVGAFRDDTIAGREAGFHGIEAPVLRAQSDRAYGDRIIRAQHVGIGSGRAALHGRHRHRHHVLFGVERHHDIDELAREQGIGGIIEARAQLDGAFLAPTGAIPFMPPSLPYPYLGCSLTLTLDWRHHFKHLISVMVAKAHALLVADVAHTYIA